MEKPTRTNRVSLLLVAPFASAAIAAFACTKEPKDKENPPAAVSSGGGVLDVPPRASLSSEPSRLPAPPPPPLPSVISPVTDIVVGTGKEAKTGGRVTVHYDASYPNGRQFETSRDRKPKTFVLGAGQVIKGWDSGIVGMKVGGRRRLVIPPELAYGAKGSLPAIPPNVVLVFVIELLDVK